jgi:hypothetical protein
MRSTRLALALALASTVAAAAAALAGCGSDPSTGTPDPIVTSNESPHATIALAQTAFSGRYAISASAFFAGTFGETPPCPVTMINSQCDYTACPATAGVVDAGALPSFQAGTVTIGGPTIPDGGLALAVTSGSYPELASTVSTPYFHGGDSITFAAPGDPGSVGAFSFSMPAPADVVVTSPSFASGNVVIARGTDFPVTWQPGIAGTAMAVTLYQLDATGGASKLVSCVFDAATGSGTLPSAGGFANFDVIDGTTTKGELFVLPYAYGSASTTAADGTTWSIYGTVTATSAEGPFTLP